MALRVKSYILSIDYSKKNMKFLELLKKKGFISTIVKNDKILVISLRYDKFLSPVLHNFSINSKKGNKSSQNCLSYLSTNYITNLKIHNKKKARLLARFL